MGLFKEELLKLLRGRVAVATACVRSNEEAAAAAQDKLRQAKDALVNEQKHLAWAESVPDDGTEAPLFRESHE